MDVQGSVGLSGVANPLGNNGGGNEACDTRQQSCAHMAIGNGVVALLRRPEICGIGSAHSCVTDTRAPWRSRFTTSWCLAPTFLVGGVLCYRGCHSVASCTVSWVGATVRRPSGSGGLTPEVSCLGCACVRICIGACVQLTGCRVGPYNTRDLERMPARLTLQQPKASTPVPKTLTPSTASQQPCSQ